MFSTYGFRVPEGGGTRCDDETDMATDVHNVRTIVDAMRPCAVRTIIWAFSALRFIFLVPLPCCVDVARRVMFLFAWLRVRCMNI